MVVENKFVLIDNMTIQIEVVYNIEFVEHIELFDLFCLIYSFIRKINISIFFFLLYLLSSFCVFWNINSFSIVKSEISLINKLIQLFIFVIK